MVNIWIDGASRKNGTPNCVAVGGIYVVKNELSYYACDVEKYSTSQRGELKALILALKTIYTMRLAGEDDFVVVTDSEYIYNTIHKEWYVNWEIKGWVSALEEPIKNKDCWEEVISYLRSLGDANFSIHHIKGHAITKGLGKKAKKLLIEKDPTCKELYKAYEKLFCMIPLEKIEEFEVCFEKNHGFYPTKEVLTKFIVGNMVVDSVATYYIDNIMEGT